jgi:hypothetical protein
MSYRDWKIPGWLALAWFRALCWLLVARCWLKGGDWRGLRRALDDRLVLSLRYGRGR